MNAPYGFSPAGGMSGQHGAQGAHNPYAAPHAARFPGFGPPQPTGPIAYRAHSGALKWVYLASLVGGIALMVLGGVAGGAGAEEVGVVLALLGGTLALFGRLVIALMWTYSAWAAIPADYRVTGSGKRVSPGEAVGFLFVPLYNLYWMFVVSGGLCDALDYLLRTSGSHRTAPKSLSLVSCIFQFVPYMNILVAPFLWFFYMLSFDSAAMALQTASASGGGAGPQGFGGGGYAPPAGGYGAPMGGYGGPPPGYGPPAY
ncbi:MAG: DUF4328 domain-containing protein [Myxococcales bacterium]|nr:DUF4328 domain-containing protein [Myxococcales bacterium]HQY62881.1 DUF4328 domain-containing protein [Polyangiaceae bacterium]